MDANAHLLPRQDPQTAKDDTYYPTSATDIYKAYHILHKDSQLPAELSILILDFAEYHLRACTTRSTPQHYSQLHQARCYVQHPIPRFRTFHSTSTDRYDSCACNTAIKEPPSTSPCLSHVSRAKVMKIILTTRSHDQGWSDDAETHGTYDHSWTWFDLAVTPQTPEPEPATDADEALLSPQRAVMPLHPDSEMVSEHRVVTNRHAVRATTEHRVVFLPSVEDCSFVEGAVESEVDGVRSVLSVRGRRWVSDLLREDVSLDLLAQAAFPGWVNHVQGARIEVFTSVL